MLDRVTPQVRAHLSLLFAALALVKAAGYIVQRWTLLYSGDGVVQGATYTDLKARLPAINLLFFVIPISISDSKTGFIVHGGVEGEWLVHKRLGVFGRGLLRSAKASGLDFGQINIYGGGPMGQRDVDFSGFALHAGVRAYIGY